MSATETADPVQGELPPNESSPVPYVVKRAPATTTTKKHVKKKPPPSWPPKADSLASPLYSLAGMYAAFQRAMEDEQPASNSSFGYAAWREAAGLPTSIQLPGILHPHTSAAHNVPSRVSNSAPSAPPLPRRPPDPTPTLGQQPLSHKQQDSGEQPTQQLPRLRSLNANPPSRSRSTLSPGPQPPTDSTTNPQGLPFTTATSVGLNVSTNGQSDAHNMYILYPVPVARAQQAAAVPHPDNQGWAITQQQSGSVRKIMEGVEGSMLQGGGGAAGPQQLAQGQFPREFGGRGARVDRPTTLSLPLGTSHMAPTITTRTQHTGLTSQLAPHAKTDSKNKAQQAEIRLVPNAPAIPPAGRAVHPFFLAGTLLHGLPSTPSNAITGEKPRRLSKAAPPPPSPIGWTTGELVNNCVRPALGPTRIAYVQALACDAAEVPWCPGGRFTADLGPAPTAATGNTGRKGGINADSQSKGRSMGAVVGAGGADGVGMPGAAAVPVEELQVINIPKSNLSEEPESNTGQLQLVLPTDLAGRLAYGPVSYYVIHAWLYKWEDVVAAILQHYARLPEVVRTGGAKFMPIYYWVDVFAVPQFERPCPELKHHPDRVLSSVIGAPTCKAALLAAQPWSNPIALSRAWCLYEVSLARALSRELQVLMVEEQPGPEAFSPRLPLARLSGFNDRNGQTGDLRVVQIVDAMLAGVDIVHAATRIKADMDFIMSQARDAPGGIVGFNIMCRAVLRPYLLAALLSTLLRSAESRIWVAARALIQAGAFLQWTSSTFTVDVQGPSGPADEAAAFLGAALRTRALRVDVPPTAPNALEGCNPIQEIVFLPPAGANTSAGGAGGPRPTTAAATADRRTPTGQGAAVARADMGSAQCSSPLRGASSRPGTAGADIRAASPRWLADSGIVSRSPRNLPVDTVLQEDDAIARSLARHTANGNLRGRNPGDNPTNGIGVGTPSDCLSMSGMTTLSPGLAGNTSVTRLCLSGHPIGCGGVQALVDALLVKQTALTCLKLNGCAVGVQGAKWLGQLLGATSVCRLVELDLGNNAELDAEGVAALATGLPVNLRLRRLQLNGCQAGTESTIALAQALQDQLKTVAGLPGTLDMTSAYASPVVSHRSGNSQAKSNKAGQNRAAGGPGLGLQVLDLSDNNLGPEAAEALAQVLAHPSCALVELKLAHNLIQTQGALAIARAIQGNHSLQVLSLRNTQLALEVGAALGTALSGELPQGVRPASPPHPPIMPPEWPGGGPPPLPPAEWDNGDGEEGDSGVSLPRLRPGWATGIAREPDGRMAPCRLTHLDLGENILLGEVGVILLAQGLSAARGRGVLRELLLDSTGCGPASSTALAQVLSATSDGPTGKIHGMRRSTMNGLSLRLPSIQHLDLSNNAIGTAGAVALAAVVPTAVSLERLLLKDCQIGADGRLAILAALQLSASSILRLLDLTGNGGDPALYVPPPIRRETAPQWQAKAKVSKPRAPPGQAEWLATTEQYGQVEESLLHMHDKMQQASQQQAEMDAQPPGGGLSKHEAILAQSLTMARQLQLSRTGMNILF